MRKSLGLRDLPLGLCLLLLLLPASARAERGIEITPFAGLLVGGSFWDGASGDYLHVAGSAGFGLVLGLLDTPRTHYELVYSFQRTGLRGGASDGSDRRDDLDIHYLHVGSTYEFTRERFRPFISAGAGLTALDLDGGGSSAHFSLSLGGGVKIPLSDRVGLRLEGRGYLTILADSVSVFCISSGGGSSCDVGAGGDSLGQFEALAGLYFML